MSVRIWRSESAHNSRATAPREPKRTPAFAGEKEPMSWEDDQHWACYWRARC